MKKLSASATTAAAPGTPDPVVTPFDVSAIAKSTAALPPFPYIALPEGIPEDAGQEIDFDRAYVLAGSQWQPVEGHISRRKFFLADIKMSPLAAYRNYDETLKSLGAVHVNTVQPHDPALIAQNGGEEAKIRERLRLDDVDEALPSDVPGFIQYLLRTPSSNVWICFSVSNQGSVVGLLVVEEKALEQKVGVVPASAKASAP